MNLEPIGGLLDVDGIDPFFILISILIAIPTGTLLFARFFVTIDYIYKRYFSRATSNFVTSLAINHSRHRIYNPSAVDLKFRRCYMEIWSNETDRIALESIEPTLLSSGDEICKQP